MRPTKSKAVAVIDGQIELARKRLAEYKVNVIEAEAQAESAQDTLDILEETRNRVLAALANRKKPEKASKTATPPPVAT